MDIFFIVLCVCTIFLICFSFLLYIRINTLMEWNLSVTELLSRTFKQYYKGENIEPVGINWGIDLVWNPSFQDAGSKRGFVTIYYGEDSGVDTPLMDAVDADKLSSELIPVIEKYLQDRDLNEHVK